MKRIISAAVCAAAIAAAGAAPTVASGAVAATSAASEFRPVHIGFDRQPSHCSFSKTQRLTEEYASLGVHFQGPTSRQGGAILDQCARFGVRARSGSQFLAFNATTYAVTPETMTFDRAVTRVACYVANGEPDESTYELTARRDGEIVAATRVTVQSKGYTGIAVRARRGIDSVELSAFTPDDTSFVLDDLTFTPKG